MSASSLPSCTLYSLKVIKNLLFAKLSFIKHNVKTFSTNFSLYGDISRRVMKTLKQFSPKMEIYSIDEAFLDLSSVKNEDLLEHCYKIRKTILKWTGIPTSIGIATTKTLSKAANYIAKKDKTS